MMNRVFLLIIPPVFILSSLLVINVALATVPESFSVPSQYGTIKEIFNAPQLAGQRGRTIIYLQDAHCNYEAQRNIANILEYLIKEYGLRLVMVEGGSGNVNISFLRTLADGGRREQIAEDYLKRGEISGEEYLDLVSSYDFELYGIEDEGLYEAHLSSFQRVYSIREKALKELEVLSDVVERLKIYIYSKPLRDLERYRDDYREKIIALAEYCSFLSGMAARQSIDINSYPNLSTFLEVIRLEGNIDFSQAEIQRNIFIKELAVLVNKQERKEIIDKSREFKSGQIPAQDYYSFLKGVSEGRIELDKKYPQLSNYIRYLIASKKISVRELLREVDYINEEIKETLFSNNDQRRLSKISKCIGILRSLLNLELTTQEYEYFKENRSDFLTSSWMDFLVHNSQRYYLAVYPAHLQTIDDNLNNLEEFYQFGAYRERSLVRNLIDRMSKSTENLAVLIAGGFHTPGISKMLKERGYSYVVVTPVLTKRGDSSVYFSVLRGLKR